MGSLGKAAAARDPNTRVVHYGSRKGTKLIRIYKKEELNVFRIEGEFHSFLLRRHRIDTEQDLNAIADVFYPRHIRFVEVDWKRLRKYLMEKYGKDHGEEILKSARKKRSSIRRVTRYLRREGVFNVHRFYRPLKINKDIKGALDDWSSQFDHEWQLARQRTDRGKS
jgi:hypothetical protein